MAGNDGGRRASRMDPEAQAQELGHLLLHVLPARVDPTTRLQLVRACLNKEWHSELFSRAPSVRLTLSRLDTQQHCSSLLHKAAGLCRHNLHLHLQDQLPPRLPYGVCPAICKLTLSGARLTDTLLSNEPGGQLLPNLRLGQLPNLHTLCIDLEMGPGLAGALQAAILEGGLQQLRILEVGRGVMRLESLFTEPGSTTHGLQQLPCRDRIQHLVLHDLTDSRHYDAVSVAALLRSYSAVQHVEVAGTYDVSNLMVLASSSITRLTLRRSELRLTELLDEQQCSKLLALVGQCSHLHVEGRAPPRLPDDMCQALTTLSLDGFTFTQQAAANLRLAELPKLHTLQLQNFLSTGPTGKFAVCFGGAVAAAVAAGGLQRLHTLKSTSSGQPHVPLSVLQQLACRDRIQRLVLGPLVGETAASVTALLDSYPAVRHVELACKCEGHIVSAITSHRSGVTLSPSDRVEVLSSCHQL